MNVLIKNPNGQQQIVNYVKIKEKWHLNLIQIIIPFLIAGFGMVSAGVLLEKVQVKQKKIIKITS